MRKLKKQKTKMTEWLDWQKVKMRENIIMNTYGKSRQEKGRNQKKNRKKGRIKKTTKKSEKEKSEKHEKFTKI